MSAVGGIVWSVAPAAVDTVNQFTASPCHTYVRALYVPASSLGATRWNWTLPSDVHDVAAFGGNDAHAVAEHGSGG